MSQLAFTRLPEGCLYFEEGRLKEVYRASGDNPQILIVAEASGTRLRADKGLSPEFVREMVDIHYDQQEVHGVGIDLFLRKLGELEGLTFHPRRIYDGISRDAYERADVSGVLDAGEKQVKDYLPSLDAYFLAPVH